MSIGWNKKSRPQLRGLFELVPEVGLEPTSLAAEDFLPTSAFAAVAFEEAAFVVWSTPSPWPFGLRCSPSGLCTLPGSFASGLGSALARTHRPGSSSSLTGFTSRISPRGLKFGLSPLRLPIPPLGQ